jgi:YVTN family beta-propeller protein
LKVLPKTVLSKRVLSKRVSPRIRKARRRSTSAASAFALAVAGLVGVSAAPAHAATAMNFAYVVDSGANAVRVVDVATSTIVGSIPVGYDPQTVVVSADKRTAYVTNLGGRTYGDSTVSVIDTAAGTVTHTIPVCTSPTTEAMKPDGGQLWVGCYSGGISEIDTATDTIASTPVMAQAPEQLAFAPDGSKAYAQYHASPAGPGGVVEIDAATGAITPVFADSEVGSGLLISPDGSKLFVGYQYHFANAVAVVDTASGTVTSTIPLGGQLVDGIVNPAGTEIYYCMGSSGLLIVDMVTEAVVGSMAVPCGSGSHFPELAFSPDGSLIYATLGYSGVSVIDVADGTVAATFKTGAQLVNPLSVAFVRAAVAPTVTAISPAQGLEAGGNKVVITGGPFVGGSGASAVSFGGVPAASFTVDSDSQITAVVPAQTARTVDVTVANDNGTSAVSGADQYTYRLASPTVGSLSPSSGVSSGGTSVVITGTNLSSTSAVYFGGTAASSFTVDSDTQVTAVTRAQTNGTVNVSVTNAAGTSVSVPGSQYTFFSPVPVVTSISPDVGYFLSSTAVTVTGMRFTGTFRVTVGGVSAVYRVDSDSQITVVVPPFSSSMTRSPGFVRPNALIASVDIQVITDVGSSLTTSADVFRYVAPT